MATFSPDGSKILTGSADCTAQLWDNSDINKTIVRLEFKAQVSHPLVYARNNKLVVYNNRGIDGDNIRLVIYNLQGRIVAIYKSEMKDVSSGQETFDLPPYRKSLFLQV